MKVTRRDLVGRKIVSVDFRRFHDKAHGWCTDPVLTLDDGRRIWIVTEETADGGEYGHMLCISEKKKPHGK